MTKRKIWWPQGAGGMWVNYLLWAGKENRNIGDKHVDFNYVYLKKNNPEYNYYVTFAKHLEDPADSGIRIGNHHAWFNFYLNVCAKKVDTDDILHLRNSAKMILNYVNRDIDFNLDWQLIFTDPEKFIAQLNLAGGYNITYNQAAQFAFTQYQHSCLLPNLDSDEFQQSNVFKCWHDSVVELLEINPTNVVEFTQNIYCKPENFLL